MKRKININREPLTSEEINSTKNFDSLLKKVASTSFFSNRIKTGLFATGIAVTAIIIGVFIGSKELSNKTTTSPEISKNNVNSSENNIQKEFIQPVLQEAYNLSNTYFIEAEKGGKITHSTGSVITFPANVFRDKEGELIKGKVEIKYQEYHDQLDIFLSGIPMEYDSAGETYVFESAGMMSIHAYQNGKELDLVKNEKIEVSMHSNNSNPKYNLYYLEEKEENWKYKGKDNIISNNDFTLNLNDTNNEISPSLDKAYFEPIIEEIKLEEIKLEEIKNNLVLFEKTQPVCPKKANPKKKNFSIDIIRSEFPDLYTYKGTIFEVTEDNKLPKDIYSTTWNEATLKKDKKQFTIELIKDNRKEKVNVIPVLDKNNYDIAKKEFDKKHKLYTIELGKRLQKEAEAKKKLIDLKNKFKKEQEAYQRTLQANRNNTEIYKNKDIKRVYNITAFGTWNCDSPIKPPTGVTAIAEYNNDFTGEKISFTKLNLIEKETNACFSLNTGNNLTFNPKKSNVLWGITPDKQIAVCDFKNIVFNPKKDKTIIFNMKIISTKNKSAQEIRQLIEG